MSKTLADFGIPAPIEPGIHWIACPFCVKERRRKEALCMRVIVGNNEEEDSPDESSWDCLFCGCRGETTNGTYSLPDVQATRRAYEQSAPTITGNSEWEPNALKRLTRRGISEATIARCGVTFERTVWIPAFEQPINAIALPHYRAGKLVAVEYITNNGATYIHGEHAIYGIDDVTYQQESGTIVPQDITYVVPDQMSKLAMDTAGFPNTIALPYLPPKKDTGRYYELLDHANYKLDEDDTEGLLDKIETIIIAAGPHEKLQEELVRRLGRDRCCIIRWPKWPLDRETIMLWDGRKVLPGDTLRDANEVLFCLGVEGLQAAVHSAKPMRIDGVYRVSDFKPELDDYYEHGLPPGVRLPWAAFRNEAGNYCLQPKEQLTWVVTGVPGHGKSRWVENVQVELARAEDWKIAYFSPEVNPKQLHASYLISQWAGLPFNRGYSDRMNREIYEAGAKWLDEHFFFLETDLLPFGVDDLLERATKLVRKFGVNSLVIDPWNNVYHSRKAYEREDEYIGQALQRINAWRARNNAMATIIAHPTKLRPENGKEARATLSDIKGGSEWFSMADFGISVWRDRLNENIPTQVSILKVKFQHLGTMGIAHQRFDKPTSKFYDAGIPFDGVRPKETNRDEGPHFAPPDIDYGTDDGAPRWMQGSEYDV